MTTRAASSSDKPAGTNHTSLTAAVADATFGGKSSSRLMAALSTSRTTLKLRPESRGKHTACLVFLFVRKLVSAHRPHFSAALQRTRRVSSVHGTCMSDVRGTVMLPKMLSPANRKNAGRRCPGWTKQARPGQPAIYGRGSRSGGSDSLAHALPGNSRQQTVLTRLD